MFIAKLDSTEISYLAGRFPSHQTLVDIYQPHAPAYYDAERSTKSKAKEIHIMSWDWTIKITDVIMVVAIVIGPIIAVRITEKLRHKKDSRDRKVHIFRTLMATRSAPLAAMHVEALNLVELEFQVPPDASSIVVAAARLYMDHLNDRQYPKDMWGSRKGELLVDLLYEMSRTLGYNFDKVQIKAGSYYPSGYSDAEDDNYNTRKLWLEILHGKRTLPIHETEIPFQNIDKPSDGVK